MDIVDWVWLLGAFWCGGMASLLALALTKAGHNADARRSRQTPGYSIMTDLESDTVSRF